MSQLAKAQEPTMEEILASIRRIIADDDAAKPGAAAAKPAPASAPEPAEKNNQDDIDAMLAGFDAVDNAAPTSADVLELTESMQAKPPAFNTIEGPPDVVFSEAPEPERPRPFLGEPSAAPVADRTLLSPRTTAAVDMAFNTLAHTVLVQNSRTLEDLVREMLKPMLKAWLDDNLPNMVERLVRAEIERVSRGRG
jgi:cell pole-organizing protein PopZ